MKIIMVTEFYDDNLDYQENFLTRIFHELGHSVTVITSTIDNISDYYADIYRKREYYQESYSWGNIHRLPFRINLLSRIRVFNSIYDLLLKERPDLIYFHDIIPNIIEAKNYIIKNSNVKMILDYHADESNSGKNALSRQVLHGTIRKYILNKCRPYISKIYPITPGSIRFLKKYYKVPEAEMELLPLGVDMKITKSMRQDIYRTKIRQELGILGSDLVAFSGGKWVPEKRIEDILAAAKKLEDLSIHVILIGKGDSRYPEYTEYLELMASNCKNVHLVGWQSRLDVYKYLAASDVGVFPAGQTVLWQQCLGMGLPLILAEESRGFRGKQDALYLDRNENLIILQPAEEFSVQIEHHLLALNNDRIKLKKMSQGALKTAEQFLDYYKIVVRIIDNMSSISSAD